MSHVARSSRPAASEMATHEVQPIGARVFREVCGLFVTGVAIVIAEGDGQRTGTTVNSFTSVSLDPPLVLFCLHRQSRLCMTIRKSETFVVNFLAGQQERLARAFAHKETAGIDGVDRLHSRLGMPVLSGALAFLACRLVDEFPGGDHRIFLGEVTELGIPRRRNDPLIFFRGSMSALEPEPRLVEAIWDG